MQYIVFCLQRQSTESVQYILKINTVVYRVMCNVQNL